MCVTALSVARTFHTTLPWCIIHSISVLFTIGRVPFLPSFFLIIKHWIRSFYLCAWLSRILWETLLGQTSGMIIYHHHQCRKIQKPYLCIPKSHNINQNIIMRRHHLHHNHKSLKPYLFNAKYPSPESWTRGAIICDHHLSRTGNHL